LCCSKWTGMEGLTVGELVLLKMDRAGRFEGGGLLLLKMDRGGRFECGGTCVAENGRGGRRGRKECTWWCRCRGWADH
jgi:hypothetical protein